MLGFVYIWYDKKRVKYYIGSHIGAEDDGYVCSSPWMSSTYKRRPNDFRRRILERVDSRPHLLEAEQRWISMIRPDEVGVRYYNLCLVVTDGWWFSEESTRKVASKMSRSRTGKARKPTSAETKRKMSEAKLRYYQHNSPWNKGKTHSKETKEKLRRANLGKKYSDEYKKRMSDSLKGRKVTWGGKISKSKKGIPSPLLGRTISKEHRKNLSKPKEKIVCPRCQRSGGIPVMKRWHFENCKW